MADETATPAREDADASRGGWHFVKTDRYLLVFVLIVLSLLASAFLGSGNWGLLLSLLLLSATMLVAMDTSGLGRIPMRIATGIVAFGLVAILVADRIGYTRLANLGVLFALAGVSTITPVVIAMRLLRHPKITLNTIAGAADVYLLVAFFYAMMFSLIGAVQLGVVRDLAQSHAIHGTAAQAFFVASRPVTGADFFHFSLTVLTTVGYGDLIPSSDFGRIFADTEALLGQLYLVTVVAVIVGNVGMQWRKEEAELEERLEDAEALAAEAIAEAESPTC